MAAGHVNRTTLQSYYQHPGDVYDDAKTEGAFETVAQQVDENYDFIALMIASGTLSRLGLYNLVDYGDGDGTTDDYAELNSLLGTIGSTAATILINATFRIGTNITIPSNVTLMFLQGGMLKPDSGVTITVNGPILAGVFQIFTGDGTIAGEPKIDFAVPQWFGAKGDWVNDDTDAMNKAIEFYNKVYIPAGGYLVTDTISYENKHIFGANWDSTYLRGMMTDATKPIMAAGRTSVIEHIQFGFPDARMTGSESRGQRVGLRTYGGVNGYSLQRGSAVKNCAFYNCGTAIHDGGEPCFSVSFENLEIMDFSNSGIDFYSYNRTGNIYSNIYMGQIDDKYEPSWGLNLEGEESECSIHQLNVEHMVCAQPIRLKCVRGVSASSIHIEGTDLKGDYNGYIDLDQVSGTIDTISFYFTRMTRNGTSLFKLRSTPWSDGNPNLVSNSTQRVLQINHLICKGLARPDADLYPDYPPSKVSLNGLTDFFFFFRDSSYSDRDYQVDIGDYSYATYNNNDDRTVYDNFPVDPHSKIRFLKKGQLTVTGTTAERPTKRLCSGVTTYFDTTLNKLITWNGTNWRDGSGTSV